MGKQAALSAAANIVRQHQAAKLLYRVSSRTGQSTEVMLTPSRAEWHREMDHDIALVNPTDRAAETAELHRLEKTAWY